MNPAVVVPKPTGDVRFHLEMRCAKKCVHPIPIIDEVLEDIIKLSFARSPAASQPL